MVLGASGTKIEKWVPNPTAFCYTLEPPKQPIVYPQWPDISFRCINTGKYKVTRVHSPHFKMDVPLINGVTGRSNIEIHPANYGSPHLEKGVLKKPDTEGCLGVGYDRSPHVPDFIGSSKVAFENLCEEIFPALASGEEVWITYVENFETEVVTKSPKIVEVDPA
jgi:hypothetical protein